MFLVNRPRPAGWSGRGGGLNVIVGCVPPPNGRSSHLIEAAKRGRLDQMIFFSAPLTIRAPPGRPAGRPAQLEMSTIRIQMSALYGKNNGTDRLRYIVLKSKCLQQHAASLLHCDMSLVSKKNGKTVFCSFFSGPHFSGFSETVFLSFFFLLQGRDRFSFVFFSKRLEKSEKQMQKIWKNRFFY